MKNLLITLSLLLCIFCSCTTFQYEKCFTINTDKIPELEPITEIIGNVVITPCYRITLNWEDIKNFRFSNMVKIWFADGMWQTQPIQVNTETDSITKTVPVNPEEVVLTKETEPTE